MVYRSELNHRPSLDDLLLLRFSKEQSQLLLLTLTGLQECCGCCSLGLQIGREGERCVAPQSLGYHCRHVFLNCCREEEKQEEEMAESQGSWHSVQERPTQDYSAPPKKGTVNKYSLIPTHTFLKCAIPARGGGVIG